MGEKTGISWTDHTFNPWIGCAKVSAGCTNCYAERENRLFNWVEGGWGPSGHRRKTSTDNWKKPKMWNKGAKKYGVRRKVFCASLSDVFEDRPELEQWRGELWSLIVNTPDLNWLLLTKRPENVLRMCPHQIMGEREEWIPPNVWIGATCENQEMYNQRLPVLLDIPARIKFISVEPMLGMIDLGEPNCRTYAQDRINWVICGGESGPSARPMNIEWARNLRNQCQDAKVPFFFKQVGGNKRIDGHWGGDLLDGVQYHEFPEEPK
jgi:protein gp37